MVKEIEMNKLLSVLAACMLALAMNGFAVAADEPRTTQQAPQAQPGQSGDVSAKEQEYVAALKKCESLSGSQQTKCIETAKKKLGLM
jgi:Flp pilus assembly protein TadD